MELEITETFEQAHELMEDPDRHVFLTGKAGTGKSTLLEYFREHSDKDLAVLAPTGVAAVNVRGQTVHSFFGFSPDVTVKRVEEGRFDPRDDQRYRNLETLVIDEVSMVRADLMDCIDAFLRRHGPDASLPMGGVKTILIGDPFQLEPVTKRDEEEFFETHYDSPWFFDSHVFEKMNCRMIELTTIHRQQDEEFIRILNGIRTRTITEEQLARLNEQVNPGYDPGAEEYTVYLTPTNAPADEINRDKLSELEGSPEIFEATLTGSFESSQAPTETKLQLKTDAQVMMLNNDARERWVNGTMGRVREMETGGDEPVVKVELETGDRVSVTPYEWEMVDFDYDEDEGKLVPRTHGTFEQLPMRLAWAVTIHKSQGKTLDRVVLDTRKASMFAHGQAYVALSRCTSLEGLILKEPLTKRDVWMDWRVTKFFKEYHLSQSEQMPAEEREQRLQQAIESDADVEILYVNSRGEKSRRTLRPQEVGTFEYRGNSFRGLKAHSYKHDESRNYSLKRIARVVPVVRDETPEAQKRDGK